MPATSRRRVSQAQRRAHQARTSWDSSGAVAGKTLAGEAQNCSGRSLQQARGADSGHDRPRMHSHLAKAATSADRSGTCGMATAPAGRCTSRCSTQPAHSRTRSSFSCKPCQAPCVKRRMRQREHSRAGQQVLTTSCLRTPRTVCRQRSALSYMGFCPALLPLPLLATEATLAEAVEAAALLSAPLPAEADALESPGAAPPPALLLPLVMSMSRPFAFSSSSRCRRSASRAARAASRSSGVTYSEQQHKTVNRQIRRSLETRAHCIPQQSC